MTERRADDAARSTTDPDAAPQVETEKAEPGTRPAVKSEGEVGPHDTRRPWDDEQGNDAG
jgi:hypothetical protein